MKSGFALLALIATFLSPFPTTAAQAPEPLLPSGPLIVGRGPNHRVWNRTVTDTLPNGQTLQRITSFTEIGSGLHKLSETGEWIDANDTIEIINGAGVARGGQAHVIFDPNLHSQGSIDLLTPDGKRLRSHILGISYFDGQQNILVAEVKDRIGEIFAPSRIAYRDAFTDYNIDVVYTYTKAGVEQDVVLREVIPLPQGFNPETTVLEIYTEFLEAPEPVKTTSRITLRKPAQGQPGRELFDETLHFGAMMIPPGRAFPFTDNARPALRDSVPVGKSWQVIEGRTFLIESIPYPLIAAKLQALPQAAMLPKKDKVQTAFAKKELPKIFPPRRVAKVPRTEPMRMAAGPLKSGGYTIDYALVITMANTHFRADTTYFINSLAYLSDNTIFEGGSVIKFSTTNYAPIELHGTIECLASAYHPVVITSQQDSSAGENLYAAGGPTNYASAIGFSSTGMQLQYFRISYADVAVHSYEINMRHSQIVHCGAESAFQTEYGPCNLDNVLLYDIGKAFDGVQYQATLTHATINGCNLLSADWYGEPEYCGLNFTNSLIVDTSDFGVISSATNSTYTLTGGSNIFVTVGAGAHYLKENSPYRDAGNTNIASWLRSDFATMTTYPPTVLTNPISINTTLAPTAQRDVDGLPDVGFHYNSIDHAVNSVGVSNATLTIASGTVLAAFGSTNGLILEYGGLITA